MTTTITTVTTTTAIIFPGASQSALGPSGCRPTRPWSSLASPRVTWVLSGATHCTLGPPGRHPTRPWSFPALPRAPLVIILLSRLPPHPPIFNRPAKHHPPPHTLLCAAVDVPCSLVEGGGEVGRPRLSPADRGSYGANGARSDAGQAGRPAEVSAVVHGIVRRERAWDRAT